MMGKTVFFVKVEFVIILIFIDEYTTQEPKHDYFEDNGELEGVEGYLKHWSSGSSLKLVGF